MKLPLEPGAGFQWQFYIKGGLDSPLYICYNSNIRTFVRTQEGEMYCQMKRINHNYINGHQDTGALPINHG